MSAAERPAVLTRAVLGLALLAACASTEYGSRQYPITLTTVPPGCQGWIIPNTDWVVDKETILRDGIAALDDYESISTPWTGSRLPYVHVFVAADANRRLRWVPFTPSRDTEVVIDFGPATQPAED
jgi:hypothetical protein